MSIYKVDYFVTMCSGIASNFWMKLYAGVVLSILSFLFDGVLKDAMIAIFALCLFDFVTAILAVRRTPHEMIVSSKIWRSAAKIGVYFLLIAAGHISETATGSILPFIDETIIGFLAVTELISILENVAKMGYAVPHKLLRVLSDYKESK